MSQSKFQLAPTQSFTEPQRRELNTLFQQIGDSQRRLLDTVTIANLPATAPLVDAVTTINAILSALRTLGLGGA